MKSTNYYNAFIEVAEDCPVTVGEIPPVKADKKSIANLQFEMVYEHPYEFSSDEVIFAVFATRNEISDEDMEEQRHLFFAKGQPCLRSSPLTKRYGWGVHSNEEGKIAIYAAGTDDYQRLVADKSVIKTKAMRSKRA